jgi:hypothetical protein
MRGRQRYERISAVEKTTVPPGQKALRVDAERKET